MLSPPPTARTRLLIIDDSLDFQVLIKTFLKGTNFLCISAPDGLQAMGTALREKPRVILLDIGLPGGDGLLLLGRLRKGADGCFVVDHHDGRHIYSSTECGFG